MTSGATNGSSGSNGAGGVHAGAASARMDALALFVAGMLEKGARQDSWRNIVTGLGVGQKDARVATQYTARAPIDRITLENLYEQDDLFPLVIDRIPEHATRRWIQFTGIRQDDAEDPAVTGDGVDPVEAEDFGRELLEAHEELGTQGACYDVMRLDRLYGGAAILLGADDGQDPDKPLAMDRIKKLAHLNVLNRHELSVYERDLDPFSPTYRQPLYYSAAYTGQRIHHSRVLRFRPHRVASDTSIRGQEGWDLSIAERVWEPLRQFGTLYGYVESLFQDLVQGSLKMKGLAEALSANNEEATGAVINRVRTIALVRSIFNMILLDEDETYDRKSSTPAGLSDLMLRSMDRLAGAAETPLSILFGQAPTGLSTDDKGGRTSFYDGVRNKQNRLLRPIITRITEVLIAAKQGPFRGNAPEDWTFDFLPLEEPNAKEDADTRLLHAQTDQIYYTISALTSPEIRSRLKNDPRSPYTLDTSVDDAAVELEQQALAAAQIEAEKRAPVMVLGAAGGDQGGPDPVDDGTP